MEEGVYRDQNFVFVRAQRKGLHAVAREDYEAGGGDPPFGQLPTKEDFALMSKGVVWGGDD